MFARGWTPLDEDVHFPPAWFAKISKLRTVGSEMPHTTWGKDGWITFNYDVMQFISDANPSYGTDIVFLVCPCTVPRGPLMWATIYQGRKMFQRTSEQGGMPADVVELLKMSPYRPNLIVMDGRIYIWLRVNYMPLPQRFLNYPLESDLIPLTKELHRRLARDMGIVGQTPWGGRA